jgi:hypothetical protein
MGNLSPPARIRPAHHARRVGCQRRSGKRTSRSVGGTRRGVASLAATGCQTCRDTARPIRPFPIGERLPVLLLLEAIREVSGTGSFCGAPVGFAFPMTASAEQNVPVPFSETRIAS